MSWQPIETCPEDGLFLAFWDYGKGLEGYDIIGRSELDKYAMSPSHWHPLPPLPEPPHD